MKPPNVLIVDDEVGPRESLKMILKPSFNTYTAEDGKEALEVIQRIPVDLVLLDLRMPGMSGEEVLKHVRGYDPTIEVVIITDYETLQSALEAIKYNVFNFILKPFDVPDVLSTVKRCIERRERATKIRKTSMDVDTDYDPPEGGLSTR